MGLFSLGVGFFLDSSCRTKFSTPVLGGTKQWLLSATSSAAIHDFGGGDFGFLPSFLLPLIPAGMLERIKGD